MLFLLHYEENLAMQCVPLPTGSTWGACRSTQAEESQPISLGNPVQTGHHFADNILECTFDRKMFLFWLGSRSVNFGSKGLVDKNSMVSCQKGPTRHVGPFWQDTLEIRQYWFRQWLSEASYKPLPEPKMTLFTDADVHRLTWGLCQYQDYI